MADFLKSYYRTAKNEGGYVNDPDDRGGETLFGISRKLWPKWEGWPLVDRWKGIKGFPENMKTDINLRRMELSFYKKYFWDSFRGDDFLIQEIADEIYDDCVNTGLTSAIRKAQRAAFLPETGKVSNEMVNVLNNLS